MTDLTINLTKLFDEINSQTPLCIIKNISKILNIKFDEKYKYLGTYINKFNLEVIKKSFELSLDLSEYEEVSKWKLVLNPFPDDKWKLENVKDGIKSLLPYFDEIVEFPTYDQISYCGFGQKTNTNPFRYNEFMCYKICKLSGYTLNVDTEFEELIYACKLILNPDEIINTKKYIIESVKQMSINNTIKMAFNCSQTTQIIESNINPEQNKLFETSKIEYKSHKIDENNIASINDNLNSITFLHQRMKPESDIEAIMMCILRFNICLFESINPIKQYNTIVKQKFTNKTIHKYIPVDDYQFMTKYTKNPSWFNINNNWFNELIPIYNEKLLKKLSISEGYINSSKEKNIISFMKDRKIINNFYFGINPYCNETVTIYQDNINDFNPDELISFGSITKNNIIYYTIEELTDYFKATKILIDPLSKRFFEKGVIEKLNYHIDHMIESNIDLRKKFQKLKTQLIYVEKAKILVDVSVKDLAVKVQMMQIQKYTSVNNLFDSIIDLAFYMRGWKVNGMEEYPIKSAQTNYDRSLYQADVDQNTIMAYHKMNDYFNELDEDLKDDIKKLNLIAFSDKGAEHHIFDMYFKNVVIDINLTLLDCISRAVTEETSSDSICIRTNSNSILFTAAWYSILFGFKEKFKIDLIEGII